MDLKKLAMFSLLVHACSVQLFVAPWAAPCQAPLSTGFPRQEYWSGLPFPSPGDLPDPGMKSVSPALVGRFFTTDSPAKPSLLGIPYLSNVICQGLVTFFQKFILNVTSSMPSWPRSLFHTCMFPCLLMLMFSLIV